MDPTGLRARIMTWLRSIPCSVYQRRSSRADYVFVRKKNRIICIVHSLQKNRDKTFMQNSLVFIRKLFGKFLLTLLRPLLKFFLHGSTISASEGRRRSSSKWE